MLNPDNQRKSAQKYSPLRFNSKLSFYAIKFHVIWLCYLCSIDFFESAKQAWISAHPEFVPKVEQLPESTNIPTPEQLPETGDIPTPEQLPESTDIPTPEQLPAN